MASAYLRTGEEATLMVALNAAEEPTILPVGVSVDRLALLHTSVAGAATVGADPPGDGSLLELAPRSGSVWRVRT
jgi:hypothetical protein